MSQITIATWNVNSLRVRLPQLAAWVAESKPDVIALQETKLPDPDFPAAEIDALGYQCAYSGQRTYNGVAVLSRQPIEVIAIDYASPDTTGFNVAKEILNSKVTWIIGLNGLLIIGFVPHLSH